GVCTGSNPMLCPVLNPCQNWGFCNPANGVCDYNVKANGTPCNDGNACTEPDSCQNGLCVGTNNAVDGTPCDEVDFCTLSDSFQGGACVGNNPLVCVPSDACHLAGACDPATGACSNPVQNDGALCDDGNACTQTDTCQNGVCSGSNDVVCPPPDAC